METHSSVPLRWSDPNSDPLADIQRWRTQMMEKSGFGTITRLWMSRRTMIIILRAGRSKRSWRRYRGRLKEQRRRGV